MLACLKGLHVDAIATVHVRRQDINMRSIGEA